jgi:hypothetical protein
VPAGSLIVVEVLDDSGTGVSGTISDGVNTYTEIGSSNLNGVAVDGRLITFYAPNAHLSAGTITYTLNVANNPAGMSAIYASNILTVSPVDSAVTATSVGNSSTPSTTSGTPAQSGELFVGGTSSGFAVTQDTGHGWAFPPNADPSNFVAGGNQVNAGTGTKIFSPTYSSAGAWAQNIIGFKHC